LFCRLSTRRVLGIEASAFARFLQLCFALHYAEILELHSSKFYCCGKKHDAVLDFLFVVLQLKTMSIFIYMHISVLSLLRRFR